MRDVPLEYSEGIRPPTEASCGGWSNRVRSPRSATTVIPRGPRCKLTIMSIDDLLVEALRLSREDRARVAAELLSSLEQTDEVVVAEWAEELLRRSADVREGRVVPVPWATAREELRPGSIRRVAGH